MLLGSVALVAGCDDQVWGVARDVPIAPPSADGYEGVREIVSEHCLLSCHDAATQLGGLDLETDMAVDTVNVRGMFGLLLVSPGAPENSMLYLKVTSTNPQGTGSDMPPGSGGLPEVLTEVVEDWILDGAPGQ